MSTVSIIEVKTPDQLKQFVRFPMDLYKNNPYYVPSFINDEINIWNADENPALQYSEAKQYLAYRNDKIVGRIAVLINHKEEKELGIRKVRFGWIDFIDDEEVSRLCFKKQLTTPEKKILIRLKAQWGSPILTKQEC